MLDALAGLPLEISTGDGAQLGDRGAARRRGPGPVVLLRGDMDALPVTEETGLPYASARSTARCTPAATTCTPPCWSARRSCSARGSDELPGTVVFMFQPGEEGYAGARHMIDEGVLDAAGERPVAAYALHVSVGTSSPRDVLHPAAAR